MSPKAYLSHTAAVILQALANGYPYGFDIMDITGLPSGTVYPALRRPPRKYYEVTKAGTLALAEAAKRYRFLARALPLAGSKPEPSDQEG